MLGGGGGGGGRAAVVRAATAAGICGGSSAASALAHAAQVYAARALPRTPCVQQVSARSMAVVARCAAEPRAAPRGTRAGSDALRLGSGATLNKGGAEVNVSAGAGAGAGVGASAGEHASSQVGGSSSAGWCAVAREPSRTRRVPRAQPPPPASRHTQQRIAASHSPTAQSARSGGGRHPAQRAPSGSRYTPHRPAVMLAEPALLHGLSAPSSARLLLQCRQLPRALDTFESMPQTLASPVVFHLLHIVRMQPPAAVVVEADAARLVHALRTARAHIDAVTNADRSGRTGWSPRTDASRAHDSREGGRLAAGVPTHDAWTHAAEVHCVGRTLYEASSVLAAWPQPSSLSEACVAEVRSLATSCVDMLLRDDNLSQLSLPELSRTVQAWTRASPHASALAQSTVQPALLHLHGMRDAGAVQQQRGDQALERAADTLRSCSALLYAWGRAISLARQAGVQNTGAPAATGTSNAIRRGSATSGPRAVVPVQGSTAYGALARSSLPMLVGSTSHADLSSKALKDGCAQLADHVVHLLDTCCVPPAPESEAGAWRSALTLGKLTTWSMLLQGAALAGVPPSHRIWDAFVTSLTSEPAGVHSDDESTRGAVPWSVDPFDGVTNLSNLVDTMRTASPPNAVTLCQWLSRHIESALPPTTITPAAAGAAIATTTTTTTAQLRLQPYAAAELAFSMSKLRNFAGSNSRRAVTCLTDLCLAPTVSKFASRAAATAPLPSTTLPGGGGLRFRLRLRQPQLLLRHATHLAGSLSSLNLAYPPLWVALDSNAALADALQAALQRARKVPLREAALLLYYLSYADSGCVNLCQAAARALTASLQVAVLENPKIERSMSSLLRTLAHVGVAAPCDSADVRSADFASHALNS
ncbi:MAG: hypothetical protein EOO41_01265, partial [Methanobacteriota archaeon]